jgi:hypothetical protein
MIDAGPVRVEPARQARLSEARKTMRPILRQLFAA